MIIPYTRYQQIQYRYTGWWFGCHVLFSHWESSSQLTFILFRGVAQPPSSIHILLSSKYNNDVSAAMRSTSHGARTLLRKSSMRAQPTPRIWGSLASQPSDGNLKRREGMPNRWVKWYIIDLYIDVDVDVHL